MRATAPSTPAASRCQCRDAVAPAFTTLGEEAGSPILTNRQTRPVSPLSELQCRDAHVTVHSYALAIRATRDGPHSHRTLNADGYQEPETAYRAVPGAHAMHLWSSVQPRGIEAPTSDTPSAAHVRTCATPGGSRPGDCQRGRGASPTHRSPRDVSTPIVVQPFPRTNHHPTWHCMPAAYRAHCWRQGSPGTAWKHLPMPYTRHRVHGRIHQARLTTIASRSWGG